METQFHLTKLRKFGLWRQRGRARRAKGEAHSPRGGAGRNEPRSAGKQSKLFRSDDQP